MRRALALSDRFNGWLADRLSFWMATMALFWLLLLVDVGVAVKDPPTNLQAWLLWAVSMLFQSIALPVLGLVGNKQAAVTQRLLQETHDSVMAELSEIKQMHVEARKEAAQVKGIDARLKALEEKGDG